jgi:hypothetical protein
VSGSSAWRRSFDDAVDAVGGHQVVGAKLAPVARHHSRTVFVRADRRYPRTLDQNRPGLDGLLRECLVEFNPPDGDHGRRRRGKGDATMSGSLEIETRDVVRLDAFERASQVRKPLQRARRQAAAARLVAREPRPLEEAHPGAAERQRSRSGRAGRAGSDHEDVGRIDHYFCGVLPALIRFASS